MPDWRTRDSLKFRIFALLPSKKQKTVNCSQILNLHRELLSFQRNGCAWQDNTTMHTVLLRFSSSDFWQVTALKYFLPSSSFFRPVHPIYAIFPGSPSIHHSPSPSLIPLHPLSFPDSHSSSLPCHSLPGKDHHACPSGESFSRHMPLRCKSIDTDFLKSHRLTSANLNF